MLRAVCPSISFPPKKNWRDDTSVRMSHWRRGRLCSHSLTNEEDQAGKRVEEEESRTTTVPIKQIPLILCMISQCSRLVVTPLQRRQIYATLATDTLQKLLIHCIIHRAGSWLVFITLFWQLYFCLCCLFVFSDSTMNMSVAERLKGLWARIWTCSARLRRNWSLSPEL